MASQEVVRSMYTIVLFGFFKKNTKKRARSGRAFERMRTRTITSGRTPCSRAVDSDLDLLEELVEALDHGGRIL